MKLHDYIRLKRGNGVALAKALGITPIRLSQYAVGYRKTNPICSLAIERATLGMVSRKDLRPDDWHLIWTDLK